MKFTDYAWRQNESWLLLPLYAIPDAIEFYQKIGFIETGEGSPNAPEMELTIAAARRLINRQT